MQFISILTPFIAEEDCSISTETTSFLVMSDYNYGTLTHNVLSKQGDCGDKDRQEALQTLFSVIFSMTRLLVCRFILVEDSSFQLSIGSTTTVSFVLHFCLQSLTYSH